ncbi:MAG: NAD(P)H-dependent oxidoreductase subunit E [Saprospiraceae bacterium]|nr:NAD(P)H-dependent oxidoreductase subunit E [Saprospiraceae bacterium]
MSILSSNTIQEITKLKSRYPDDRQKSALLPALHLAQAEQGWLPVQAMDEVAEVLDIQPIEVYEVATFYTMFHVKKVGKFVIEVCRTGPCCTVGAEEFVQYMEEKLNIKVGETTEDGLITLKTVECLAACGTGPVLQIGPEYIYQENMTKKKFDDLIEELKIKGLKDV